LVGDNAFVQQNGPTPRAPAQVQIPDGWQEYRDPWLGFSIVQPREWAGVLYDKKTIYINMDPSGFSCAILWSYNLRVQVNTFNWLPR